MSVKMMALVWDIDLLVRQKMTALALADWADDSGGSIFPQQRTLAAKTSQSRSTVQRHLKGFEEDGLLERVGRRGATGRVVEWRLNAAKLAELANSVTETPLEKASGGDPNGLTLVPNSVSSDAQMASDIDAQNHQGTVKEPPVIHHSSQATENGHWNAISAITGEPSEQQRSLQGRLVKRAREFPVEEITRRAELYVQIWPDASLTLAAFEKHWEWLASPAAVAAAIPSAEREAYQAEMRRLRWVQEQEEKGVLE